MTSNLRVDSARMLLNEFLRDISLAEAAALYGSVARGDVEPHSDVDLLLVCPSGQKRALFELVQRGLSREFTKLSLAVYSHQELSFLDRARSLFLLHLKREADVLFDRSGFLGTLLSDFRAKPSYRADFVESLTLLDPLLTRVEHSPNELHRLSYVYSLFRVFGVYLLAERGIFEFSKSRMATCLSREYPHASQAAAALSELRVLNANFFSGGENSQAPERLKAPNALPAYICALSQLIDAPIPILERSYSEAVAEFAAAAAPLQGLNYKLRTWFLLLVYDGLNLYCQRAQNPPLISFEPESLEKMVSKHLPSPVATAAKQTLSYMRDYRLKYFLSKNARVNAERATHILQALASEV